MSLRRYGAIKPSRGTTWPGDIRKGIHARDKSCRGPLVGMPGDCDPYLEIDHVRASGGIGLKSRSTLDNGILLCGRHHRLKTEHGKEWRGKLLDYIAKVS